MGNDHGGAAFDHAAQSIADAEFCFCVYAGRGFVQDQNLGIMRQGAGERDQLLLSGRKRAAALANFFLIAVRKSAYEIRQVYISAAFSTSSSLILRAQANAAAHCSAEQERVRKTTPKRRRRSARSISLTSTPSILIAPFCTS